MSIFQPSNQIKLTNVSIVKLRKGGKRFEIACYKNKVMEWRNQVETDLDEILQINSIFTNVSKGQLANTEDLTKCFKTEDKEKIILEILKKGELQVGEKERANALETLSKDIASLVADMCVNPTNKRPYTVSMIEKAIADLHYSINPNKNAKQQALEIIRQLQDKKTIPIARAQMRIRITLPGKEAKKLKENLLPNISKVEEEDFGDLYEMVSLIDPGNLKVLSDKISVATKGRGGLEVLSLKDLEEGNEKY
ncbi:Shwachman-Bodian-diamond syndrome protein [Neoconidiobolus thromboides FSU 785]|nr:Shwachman-Bodian-diamond syndrome protein [Neoconidiobolus thromboides FSU 785]